MYLFREREKERKRIHHEEILEGACSTIKKIYTLVMHWERKRERDQDRKVKC